SLYSKSTSNAAVLATATLAILMPLPLLAQSEAADMSSLDELFAGAPTGDASEAAAARDAPSEEQTSGSAPSGESLEGSHEPAAVEPVQTIAVQALKPEMAADEIRRARGTVQIEEIVVTATKREQSLRDIPASITAFNGEDLENEGGRR